MCTNEREAIWQWEEEGMDPSKPSDGLPEANVPARVEGDFAAGVVPGWDVLGDGGGAGVAVVRLAQFGHAQALRGLLRRGVSFDVPEHACEITRQPTCLITEALWGWATLAGLAGAEALTMYADAVETLLEGGASRVVRSPVSMAASWPLVREVRRRTGVRLVGWASAKFEDRAWSAGECVPI